MGPAVSATTQFCKNTVIRNLNTQQFRANRVLSAKVWPLLPYPWRFHWKYWKVEIQSLCDWIDRSERPKEKEMATHSEFLPGEPMNRGGWWATVHGAPKVGHDWSSWACMHSDRTNLFTVSTIFLCPWVCHCFSFSSYFLSVFLFLILFSTSELFKPNTFVTTLQAKR